MKKKNIQVTEPQPVAVRTHFRTSTTFSEDDVQNFEFPIGASETIPNQVLTPKEMLERYTHGLPVPTSIQEPIYSEMELPDFHKMDIDELHDYQENLQNEIRLNEEAIRASEEAEAEKLKELAIRAKIKSEQDSLNNGVADPKAVEVE